MNEFFVGYQPAPPPALQRFLRRAVAGLFAGAVAIGGALLIGQQPFAASRFEYGTLREFSGTVTLEPYPQLRDATGAGAAREEAYLLVAPGKHGAGELLAGHEGAQVRLRAQRIIRDGTTMLEIVPGSLERLGSSHGVQPRLRELGEVALTGEIVDSKCWLGVMNPGEGKVHRDCAARCLSGGIPPIFVSAAGGRQYLLVDPLLRPFARDTLRPFIAERITVRGMAFQDGPRLLLAIEPAHLSR